jgi:hypothetical protein
MKEEKGEEEAPAKHKREEDVTVGENTFYKREHIL